MSNLWWAFLAGVLLGTCLGLLVAWFVLGRDVRRARIALDRAVAHRPTGPDAGGHVRVVLNRTKLSEFGLDDDLDLPL